MKSQPVWSSRPGSTNLAVRVFLFIMMAASLVLPSTGQVVQANPGGTGLVISEVYGGGGNSGATYTNDFIELYNPTADPISVAGWSVQYASATGSSWQVTVLGGFVAPGQFYLVQEAQGAGGTTSLPTPNATGTIAMGGTAGKVALVSSTTALTGTNPSTAAGVVDFVGYGATANGFEGAGPTATLSNTLSAQRIGGGATDTDNNNADFTTGAPAPQHQELAPYVSGTIPADGANDVAPDASITVSFSEPVTVMGAWYTLTCTSSGAPAATVSGGPSVYTIDPNGDFTSGESCTLTINAAMVSDNDSEDPPDTMGSSYTMGFTVSTFDPCTRPSTPISTVQGTTDTSPLVGSTVTVDGSVVADFQGATGMNGFFLQALAPDANPATSEGIFVYVPSANPLSSVDVAAFDRVRVTGRVAEFNGMTELDMVTNVLICSSGNTVAPAVVTLPETVNGELEQYEGMLITLNQVMTVTQNFFLGRYGQVSLSSGGRLYTPTNGNGLGESADGNARRIIILDDAKSAQNPTPIPYWIGTGALGTLRDGDFTNSITGALDFGPINSDSAIRDYRIQPTAPVTFTTGNPRPVVPDAVGGVIRVASMNVLNYFNGDGLGGGFPTSRGASTQEELDRQFAKLMATMYPLDGDVYGLMEIENDGTGPDSAIMDLVDGLNAYFLLDNYAPVVDPAPGTDEIRVAMIYNTSKLVPEGPAINYQTSTPDYPVLFDRPPLAQTFHLVADPTVKFTVIVNHFKSKGSCPASGPDADETQGCWNAKRVAQATALHDWITNTLVPLQPNVLVIGDLNAYGAEDPVLTLKQTLVSETEKVPAAERYSYVFDGQAGVLDHALATQSLDEIITGITFFHVNADEPSVLNYNAEFKPPELLSGTKYASSDHDPLVLGILPIPTAVTLADTAAGFEGGGVRVNWSTVNEMALTGFNVYRATSLDGPRVKLNDASLTAKAAGSLSGASYTFVDRSVTPGVTYYYWIEVVEQSSSWVSDPLAMKGPHGLFLPGLRQ